MRQPSPVTVRPRESEDDHQIVAIHNRLHADVPPRTVELFRHNLDMGSRNAEAHTEWRVAERDGLVVGSLELERTWWAAPPGVYWAEIIVDPHRRGQGIGRQLYAVLLRSVHALRLRRLYTEVREDLPESQGFATRRGFLPTAHVERFSRLDVRAANLDGYDRLEERLAERGLHVVALAEIGVEDDAFLEALYEMERSTYRDIPSAEERSQSSRFDQWREEMLEGPGRSPHTFWVALHGERPVGVARLRRPVARAVFNAYTGVDRAYRGLGVARLLKLRTIEWARENGVDHMYTGNDSDNHRMLEINIRLGYQPLPGTVEMVMVLNG